ncbi:MAG TPA: hypothetical protein PKD91_04050, partial [Bacteroidia bacterium]|nr:hypothetical protein [Bacteroidia bacterium]
MTLLLAFFASSAQMKADHLMGGELTWTCLGSGSYKFHMVLYRDCSFPSSIGTGSVLIQNNIL